MCSLTSSVDRCEAARVIRCPIADLHSLPHTFYFIIPHRKGFGMSMAQTILVTGSTSGFGRLMVETLARQRYRVFAGMRAAAGKNAPAAEELRALAEREQLALHLVEIDVTDDASVERAIAVIIETTGRLDVVVN